MEKIDSFSAENKWLSNFYVSDIFYKGRLYGSTEAAYQAHKSLDENIQDQFTLLNPREAKSLGQTIKKRPDWDTHKEVVMYDVLKIKFQDRVLRKRLLETGNAELIESNWWHDNTWGDCSCMNCINTEGHNLLGKTLMKIRQELHD